MVCLAFVTPSPDIQKFNGRAKVKNGSPDVRNRIVHLLLRQLYVSFFVYNDARLMEVTTFL